MIDSQKFYPAGRPNILVTGGAGFLGSHLCEILVRDNNVICIDNLLNSFNYHHIESLLRNPNFYFIKKDVNEPLDLMSMPELKNLKIKFQGIQEIYHLACPTSPKNFEKLFYSQWRAFCMKKIKPPNSFNWYRIAALFTIFNLTVYYFIMQFVLGLGYKLASLGVQMVRPLKISVEKSAISHLIKDGESNTS